MKILQKTLYAIFASISISGLSACSDFLEEYSQDLAKVENWTDLDEVLLGEGYIHTGRFYIENGYAKSSCGDDFNILHLMSDEMIQTKCRTWTRHDRKFRPICFYHMAKRHWC